MTMITGVIYNEWTVYTDSGDGRTDNFKEQFNREVFVMRIVTDPKALGRICTQLSFVESNKIANDIIFWLRTHRRGKQVGDGAYAIACNQLGIDARVFVMKKPSGVWTSFINPVIVKRSDETFITGEGCLSLPDKEFKVERSQEIRVSNGKNRILGIAQEQDYAGRDAIVIQHEIDHLNGILISDKEIK